MQRRDLVTSIILSIVTCGIYLIYWQIVLTDELKKATDEKGADGVVALLFTIVTCGIYGIYWAYRIGNMVDKVTKSENNGLIYLLLTLFGLDIVMIILAQNSVNNVIS